MSIMDNTIAIEHIDVVRKNNDHMSKRIYACKKDPVTTVKWCRRNFGERGDGWDFSGANKTLNIIIWSSKLITMYEMWQE